MGEKHYLCRKVHTGKHDAKLLLINESCIAAVEKEIKTIYSNENSDH